MNDDENYVASAPMAGVTVTESPVVQMHRPEDSHFHFVEVAAERIEEFVADGWAVVTERVAELAAAFHATKNDPKPYEAHAE